MKISKVFESLNAKATSIYEWLTNEALSLAVSLQTLSLAVTMGMAFLLSKLIRQRISKLSFDWLQSAFSTSLLKGLLFPLWWLAFQGIAILTLRELEMPTGILGITSNLTIAWIAVRFFATFVRNRSLSRLLAFVAWSIAALNILGILEPTIAFLDGIAFNLGDLRISMLTLCKGIITLGFLLWGAIALSNLTERQIRNVSGLTPSLQVLLSKLLKIILIAFAILIGVSSVGIDITALAVFSGAVGVGIGFGLQKIVSNFISGIILLLDRSIKPGDVIEVEDTYGWINKLSGRHVSVITRDGKEHLIPNEDLITQKVTNWSYSSKSVRLRIPIGVSYKSDLHKVKELTLAAADGVPRVLSDPEPACLLMGFGDNSVDLELRVWIEDPSNGVANVKSDILFAVWDAFTESGIEIPFPQRDVHVGVSNELLDFIENRLRQKAV